MQLRVGTFYDCQQVTKGHVYDHWSGLLPETGCTFNRELNPSFSLFVFRDIFRRYDKDPEYPVCYCVEYVIDIGDDKILDIISYLVLRSSFPVRFFRILDDHFRGLVSIFNDVHDVVHFPLSFHYPPNCLPIPSFSYGPADLRDKHFKKYVEMSQMYQAASSYGLGVSRFDVLMLWYEYLIEELSPSIFVYSGE